MILSKTFLRTALAVAMLSAASFAVTPAAFAKGGGAGRGAGNHTSHNGHTGHNGHNRHAGHNRHNGHNRHAGHRHNGHFRHFGYRHGGAYAAYNRCWQRTRYGLVNVCEIDD